MMALSKATSTSPRFICDRGDFGGNPGVLVKPSKVTLLTADEAGYLEISVDPESSEIRRRRTPTEAGSATETTTNDALFFQSPPSGERLPARDLEERKRLQRHAQHCTSDPMYVPEDVTAPPQVGQWTNSALELEPRSNNLARFVLQRAMETRMPLFKIWLGSWTTGNVLFVVVYAALNIAALLVSDHSADRGLGTLAAANTMLLVVPATRNNVLTLLLGLPFDRVVLHHRFLGRATITIVFAHFIMYLDQLMARISEHLYWTGLGAFCFLLVILVTTFDWVRRKQFNMFYWSRKKPTLRLSPTRAIMRSQCYHVLFPLFFKTAGYILSIAWSPFRVNSRQLSFGVSLTGLHRGCACLASLDYSFIGYFALAYMHSRLARPFLLTGIGIYAVDKLIRAAWTDLPCRTTVFENRGDSIAQVRFPKNALADFAGKHKPGQYM